MYTRNIKELKNSLRLRSRSFRETMDPRRKERADQAIFRRLVSLREYLRAEWVFTYVSKPIEVDTFAFIRKALADGKRVAVPRCVPGTREMEFYEIRSERELKPGAFGVLEPEPEPSRLVGEGVRGLCVVPGFSFDSEGYRLGYGKGYYDRFLPRCARAAVYGIAYEAQKVDAVAAGPLDVRLDGIITEKGVYQWK